MDDATTVRCLLDAAGFDPPADERAELVAAYPLVRAMVASLYAVDAARDEVPALVFDPAPTFVDWH
jgi:hypothetical protein